MSRPSSEPWRWEFVLSRKEDELLSAWLARSAAAHGLSFHRFAFDYLGQRALTYRDVDVFPSARLLKNIEAGSRLSSEAVLAMTLVPWLAQLSSGVGRPGHFDAVLPRAHVARAKFRHGQQACFACLRDGVSYQRRWRLPFVVACERHEVWLRDACPYCDAPLDPKIDLAAQPMCPECYRSWFGPLPAQAGPDEAVMGLQRRLLVAVSTGQGLVIDGQEVPLADGLRGFNFLLRIDQRLGRAEALPSARSPLRLEGRRLRLQRVVDLLDGWPDAIAADGKRCGLSNNPFSGENCPQWVLRGLSGLRQAKPRARGARGDEDPVLDMLRRRRPKNWRTRYAHRLMRLAGMTRGH